MFHSIKQTRKEENLVYSLKTRFHKLCALCSAILKHQSSEDDFHRIFNSTNLFNLEMKLLTLKLDLLLLRFDLSFHKSRKYNALIKTLGTVDVT